MSIALQARVDALEKRVVELEKRLPLTEATTQEVCDTLQAKLDADRKTLTPPEKRKSA